MPRSGTYEKETEQPVLAVSRLVQETVAKPKILHREGENS